MTEDDFQQKLHDVLRERPVHTPYTEWLTAMPTGQARGRAVSELHAVAAVTLALRAWGGA